MEPGLPERLFKLRVIVARFGEMDLARWWNTHGQLGPYGAKALRRGFPRTHHFAQARATFAVAAHRCSELFTDVNAITLWRLPPQIESELDAHWEGWLDRASEWAPFFEKVAALPSDGLIDILRGFELVRDSDIEAAAKLRRANEGRTVPLPGAFSGQGEEIALLALGFAKGERGQLTVPYAKAS